MKEGDKIIATKDTTGITTGNVYVVSKITYGYPWVIDDKSVLNFLIQDNFVILKENK